jgi:hypothetical protein
MANSIVECISAIYRDRERIAATDSACRGRAISKPEGEGPKRRCHYRTKTAEMSDKTY